jgi:hypothetical protein
MTDQPLSPAAQAVLDAYDNAPFVDYDIGDRVAIAAVLRAAADQVVPETPSPSYPDDFESGAYEANQWARMRLLAIAAELEGVKYGTYRCDLKDK